MLGTMSWSKTMNSPTTYTISLCDCSLRGLGENRKADEVEVRISELLRSQDPHFSREVACGQNRFGTFNQFPVGDVCRKTIEYGLIVCVLQRLYGIGM